MLSSIIFSILLILSFGYFFRNIHKVYRNILLGKPIDRTDQKKERWKVMARIALGQGKMTQKPIAGILHILVYLGFLIINLELIEIIIDGIFGTHRVLSNVFGISGYATFTSILEIFAALVIFAITIFFIRRVFLNIYRFSQAEMTTWPKTDALIILIAEFLLMGAFLKMNAADYYHSLALNQTPIGSYPISTNIFGWYMQDQSANFLEIIEKSAWWFHIVGLLLFLNYLYISKHLHILFAFPNTYYSKLAPKGKLDELASVTNEVKLMLDPNANPYDTSTNSTEEVEKFGAADVFDLNRIQLLNAYTCTECGRCTEVCPANLTGKELSPRAIMMKVRDRIEEVGKNIDRNKTFEPDGKQLLNDYIKPEELWACTTCNACTEACPVLIDPISIIIDMRRYLVMEQSAAPQELNLMMNNIENNGAPWQFNQSDRLNWEND